MHLTTLFGIASTVATVLALPPGVHKPKPHKHKADAAVKCPIVFDGRVQSTAELTDFDSTSTSPFNPSYVKGSSLLWSQIIKFPDVPKSRFDNSSLHKPFEVTISDASIFQSQKGFRRAGLQFNGDTNTGSPGSTGVKTIHFSVKQDPQRPLNLTHEYLVRHPLAFTNMQCAGVITHTSSVECVA